VKGDIGLAPHAEVLSSHGWRLHDYTL